MKTKLFVLLVFLSSFSFAQQSLTTEQINRLADAGKIYGYVKYFHPFLQYKDINWDSAFAANVEGIIAAKNKNEYATAMRQMFSSLNDDLTAVVGVSNEDSTYRLLPTTYSIKDSILYLSMNDAPNDSYEKVQQALQNLNKVKGVIFDMRKPVSSKYINRITAGTVLGWFRSYFKGDVLMPTFRTVGYIGLPPETGFIADYEVYFKETKLYAVQGEANRDVALVFIVANTDQVPILATELQKKGKAAIIQEHGRHLLPGASMSFYIYDSILITMRTAEAVSGDGSLALVQPNATYLPTENLTMAILQAEKLISNGFTNSSKVPQSAPLAIQYADDNTYKNIYPSLGCRMLAAAKIFSVIDNFYPNKKIMDNNWEVSYRNSISKFMEAKDSLEYIRAVAELYANIDDSHGFITTVNYNLPIGLNPAIQGRGRFVPPVFTRVIEGKVVVFDIYNNSVCRAVGIQKGDIILSINGEDPIKMIEDVRKYQPASNKASQTFFICNFILFGKEEQVMKLKVKQANGKIKDISLPTLSEFKRDVGIDNYALKMYSRHDKPTFKLITKEIGYADLTSPIKQAETDSMYSMFKNTKAIIFDMRGYPHTYINIGNFAKNPDAIIGKYSIPAISSPNVKGMSYEVAQYENKHVFVTSINFSKGERVYQGKVIMLIDEAAQSAAEAACQNLKVLCDATLIGTPSAGATGMTTNFKIPGNLTLWFSGGHYSYSDDKPIQRLGLQPDIYIRPTIKGIQAGKDEVLERAVNFLQTGK